MELPLNPSTAKQLSKVCSVLSGSFMAKGYLWGMFIVLFALLPAFFVKADTFYWDDFEDYAIGPLSIQGSMEPAGVWWVWSSGDTHAVASEKTHTGERAGRATTGAGNNYYKFVDVKQPNGKITIHFLITESLSSSSFFMLGENFSTRAVVSISGTNIQCNTDPITTIGSVSLNEWHSIEVEWRFTDKKTRYRLDFFDDAGWDTDWVSAGVGMSIGMDTIAMGQPTNGYVYFDDLNLDPTEGEWPYGLPPGLCWSYDNKTSCEADEDCFWNDYPIIMRDMTFLWEGCYSKSFQEDIEIEYEEFCNITSMCLYCLSQESCEGVGCIWDTGREKCLFVAPACSASYVYSCDNQTDCELYSGFWSAATERCFKYVGERSEAEREFTTSFLEIVSDPRLFFESILKRFDFSKKPPFSWLNQMAGIVNTELNRIEDYEPQETESWEFEIPEGVALAGTTIKFFDFGWVKNEFADKVVILRTIFKYTLWLGFIGYLIQRLRTFNV